MLEFLKPENVLCRNPSSLREVFAALPYLDKMCDIGMADVEWRKLSSNCQLKESESSDEFWKETLVEKRQRRA